MKRLKTLRMKYWTSLLFLLVSLTSFGQDGQRADLLRSDGKIYVVVGVILIIFLGIVVNMIRLERKLNRIEKNSEK